MSGFNIKQEVNLHYSFQKHFTQVTRNKAFITFTLLRFQYFVFYLRHHLVCHFVLQCLCIK